MTFLRPVALSLTLLGLGLALAPTDARACGGCFAPPGAAQVVTDHRMVLSLSTQQTTLWDQFQYSGSPEDFSWILPIRYTETTRVQLASDDFLRLLDNVMLPALQQPAPPGYEPGCMPPYELDRASPGVYDSATFADAAIDTGVTVLREEVVGPYAVAIVRGTTGMGLRDWLRMNGYQVPTAVEPVIDYYLGLNMDFVALRLRAGKGLNRMVPVRVTLDGYQPRLPLRMIAAGVADRVGIALTVIAPSRVEAMNFPNLELSNNDFTYDWAAPPSDYARVFVNAYDTRNRAANDRLWLTESSMDQYRDNLSSLAARLPPRDGFAPPDGGTSMATSSPVEDVNVAVAGLGSTARVTRMRADLSVRALDRDLDLAASDRGVRDRFYQFGVERNRPAYAACPWPDSVSTPSVAEGISCSVSRVSDRDVWASALVAGLAVTTLVRRRRTRV
ncbi:MAG: DUF2330 domain-containing protein [Polyangiales bacterium]